MRLEEFFEPYEARDFIEAVVQMSHRLARLVGSLPEPGVHPDWPTWSETMQRIASELDEAVRVGDKMLESEHRRIEGVAPFAVNEAALRRVGHPGFKRESTRYFNLVNEQGQGRPGLPTR